MTSAVAVARQHGILLLICASFLACGILRLNDVSVYTPDSCRYVLLGNSLARGQGWLDATGPAPERFMINPPFYSLLIAPVELFFPFSLTAVKIWTLCWGALCLILFYALLRQLLGQTAAVLGALLLAANPLMVIFSSEALSDTPFLAFLLLGFLWFEMDSSRGEGKKLLPGALGLSVSALPLIREAGIAAVFAAGAYLASRRRLKSAAFIVLSAAGLLGIWYLRNRGWSAAENNDLAINPSILFQRYFTLPHSSLIKEFLLRAVYSLKGYVPQIGMILVDPIGTGQLSDLIVSPSSIYKSSAKILEAAKPVVAILTYALLAVGITRDVRTSATGRLRVIFFVSYLLIILVFPAHDMRYLLPILPLAIYYALKASMTIPLNAFLKGRLAAAVLVLATVPNLLGLYEIVSLNLIYVRSPEQLLHYPILPAAFRYQWKKMGAWIEAHMPEDAVLASPVKDIVLVTGGRKVVEIDPVVILPEFENLLRNEQAGYVFAPAQWRDLRAYEFAMRESHRFWFEPLPGLPNMMKVHSRFLEPAVRTPPHEVFDTLNPAELLRKGRSDLVAGRIGDALRSLRRVLELAPAEAEAVYEVMIADLMNDDMADAEGQYQRILTLQQTYSYIDYGRRHWDAAERLAEARSSTVPEERAMKLLEAASLYWKMGYPVRAGGILNDLLSTDSSYFAALQWGANISLQLRDTLRASQCLTRLERIDAANPVVKTFKRILPLGDSLNIVRTREEKFRLHLELALLYDGIGLGQEALDEAEMAAAEDSSRMEPLLFIANMLDRGSHLLAAERLYRRILARDPRNPYALAKADSISHVLSRQ